MIPTRRLAAIVAANVVGCNDWALINAVCNFLALIAQDFCAAL